MLHLCISNSAHNYNCFFIMTKEEFLHLQELQRNSGLPLMKYLDKVGLKYSTYTYWMVSVQLFHVYFTHEGYMILKHFILL